LSSREPVRLAVVVPCFNEERSITATLEALAGQRFEDFFVIVVDNASTDATRVAIERFAAAHPDMRVSCISEPAKGTGRAAGAGFRAAISEGANIVARTDADCLPEPDWLAGIVDAYLGGADFVIGRITLRTDDFRPTALERVVLPGVVAFAAVFGRLRPSNRGPQFLCPYRMCAGNNMAMAVTLYEQVGGFPDSCIEELHEDRDILNRSRQVTDRIVYRRDVRVRNSLRRVRAYGLGNTLLWYWDHRYTPSEVDVR
jgi:glycosyltransferase involved in cell wall biosynthesis